MSVGHYENFPVASRLVPAFYRPAVVAIYRFARAADDIADEGGAPPETRLRALAAFDEALRSIGRHEPQRDAPFVDLASAIERHALPLAPFHDLVSAFRQDVTVGRYATYDELQDYCGRSANPVGRLLLALYRVESADNATASDAICTGLQLANFWQDVASDWRRGRVYFPREDMARFGVDDAQIASGRVDERFSALSAFETARARSLLQSGRPLCRALPRRVGLELSAVIAGGLRILSRIDAVGGDVFRHRPQLGAADWIAVGFRALVPPRAPRVAPA